MAVGSCISCTPACAPASSSAAFAPLHFKCLCALIDTSHLRTPSHLANVYSAVPSECMNAPVTTDEGWAPQSLGISVAH